ncbi:HAD family hydrolase [Sphingomonas oryzagri]
MATAPVVARPTSVVFDVGNVLVDWNPRALFARYVTDSARLDRLMGEVLTLEWHTQHDAGRNFADTSAERIALYPDEAENIRRWGAEFDATIGDLLPGMAGLVADLDGRQVPLYAITNFSHEFWPPFRAREAALFDRFRDIVVSGEEKLIKPDPAIYALALERFGLTPGEALFVDDRADNVEAGECAGFLGHRFIDASTLRTALEQLGLL